MGKFPDVETEPTIQFAAVPEYFSFNPNTVDKTSLKKLGFSNHQINQLCRYRDKGGIFYKKKDLLKLYSMTDSLYTQLESYITIPQQQKIKKYSSHTHKTKISKRHTKKISCIKKDINSMTFDELTTIPQIGKFRAEKIMEFREKTGGLYSYHQLLSLYSFDSVVVDTLSVYSYIDTNNIDKININTASFKEMLSHPYLDYYDVKLIFRHKKLVDTIKTIDELLERSVIEEKQFKKIKNYLKTK